MWGAREFANAVPNRIGSRYQLVELLRERLYALAQGYNAQDDVDELAHDPAMRRPRRPGRLLTQSCSARHLFVVTNSYAPHGGGIARSS